MSGTECSCYWRFVGTLVFMAVVLWKAGIRSPKPGQVGVVSIASGSKAEADLWSAKLSAHGVRATVVQAYDPTRIGEDPSVANHVRRMRAKRAHARCWDSSPGRDVFPSPHMVA